jgi:beta-barrel assembly-enhancing protease
MNWGLRVFLSAFLALPLVFAASKDARDPDAIGKRDVAKGINFYSLEKEIELGKGMALDTEKDSRMLDDPVVSEYVNRVGQNLVRNSDAQVPFTIKVVDSEEVNAFAFPGGFFFVNSGLILRAASEAELAGVMAHEIAHVAARHGTRQATRAQLIDYGTIPLIFIGGWAGYAAREAVAIAFPLSYLKFSRNMEGEADMFGIEYMYKSGYDPTAFVDFFERIETLEKHKHGTISAVFSTHPLTHDRVRAAEKEIQLYLKPRPEYVVDTSEFEAVRVRLVALESRRRLDTIDPNQPVLRRRLPPSGAGEDSSDPSGRPTLKRGN